MLASKVTDTRADPRSSSTLPTAALARLPTTIGALVVVGTAIGIVHGVATRPSDPVRWVYALIATGTLVQLLLGAVNTRRSTRRSTADGAQVPDDQVVAVRVPVFNEDVQVLRRVLRVLLEQTRLPDAIAVVDDGSTCGYDDVREEFAASAARAGDTATWERTPNREKRHAQARALGSVPGATVLVTVDSDSILDRRAVERGLRSFADPRVQSVTAVLLSENVGRNALTRAMDVFCVGLQLFERSACSLFGATLVNSGHVRSTAPRW